MTLRERLIQARPQAQLYRESIEALPPMITGLRGRISSLALHPIKSLGILKMDDGLLAPEGLQTADGVLTDRMAMLAIKQSGDVDGQPYEYVRFSQREEGRLALTTPYYNGRELFYVAPDMKPLCIPVGDLEPRQEGKKVFVRVLGDGDVNPGIVE